MHSYIHPLAGAFPSFVYIQNCNATRKPLNDIPTKRYNESCTFSIFRDCSTAGDTSLLYLYNVSFPKAELILLIHILLTSKTVFKTQTKNEHNMYARLYHRHSDVIIFGEGMWESNPPRTLLTPNTSFED